MLIQNKGGFAGERAQVKPPPPYESFVEVVKAFPNTQSVSIITFNYDVALDYALHYAGVSVDYCLGNCKPSLVELLKLHGSLNWGKCKQAGCPQRVVPWQMKDFFSGRDWGPLHTQKFVTLGLTRHFNQLEHCGSPVLAEPVLVPPTWNKGYYHLGLETVWRRAAERLSQAENIIVIGYSMPPTDEFFKYFFALGSVGDTWLSRVWIFNPDEAAARRFSELLGPQSKARFQHFPEQFSTAVETLRRETPQF